MQQELIFGPIGALALLTLLVLSQVLVRRLRAAFLGKVTGADFAHGESPRVPASVALPNRNFMNLFEMPVLFYVVCLMFFVTRRVDGLILGLAWAYVAFRAAHSLVHLTYNNVVHRLAAFAASNVVLLALWIVFFFTSAATG